MHCAKGPELVAFHTAFKFKKNTVRSLQVVWVQRDSPDFRAHTHSHVWARTDLCLCECGLGRICAYVDRPHCPVSKLVSFVSCQRLLYGCVNVCFWPLRIQYRQRRFHALGNCIVIHMYALQILALAPSALHLPLSTSGLCVTSHNSRERFRECLRESCVPISFPFP